MTKNNLIGGYTAAYHPSAPVYVHQDYPKWKHHADGRSLMVDDAEAEAALGAEWYDFKHQIPGFVADISVEPRALVGETRNDKIQALAEELSDLKQAYNEVCEILSAALSEEEREQVGASGTELARLIASKLEQPERRRPGRPRKE